MLYFRARVPADVLSRLQDQQIEFGAADFRTRIRLSGRTRFVKVSLRTRQPSSARVRQAILVSQIEGVWQAIRSGGRAADALPASVSHADDQAPLTSPPKLEANLLNLFERWVQEARPASGTERDWRSIVQDFVRFRGLADGRPISREDVVAWKDDLVRRGLRPKTINDAKLAALRAVLSWGCENGAINANPAKDVRVRWKREAGQRMLGFTHEEALQILQASRREKSVSRRWIPFLCAATGARVAEIAQLRKQDVRSEKGIWFIHIDPAAGPLKNSASERRVPIHPKLVDDGIPQLRSLP